MSHNCGAYVYALSMFILTFWKSWNNIIIFSSWMDNKSISSSITRYRPLNVSHYTVVGRECFRQQFDLCSIVKSKSVETWCVCLTERKPCNSTRSIDLYYQHSRHTIIRDKIRHKQQPVIICFRDRFLLCISIDTSNLAVQKQFI